MPEPITTSTSVNAIAAMSKQESGITPPPVPKTSNEMWSGKEERKNPAPSETRFEKLLQEKLATTNQSVNISVDDVTKRIVVKIVDNATNEVVRQLPTEEMLRISRSMAETSLHMGKVTDVRI
ncbi:MAG: flagellar protein FlaG [Candidatus Kapaibacterium sp.]|jgi:flagellar protein FlaG